MAPWQAYKYNIAYTGGGNTITRSDQELSALQTTI